MLTTRSGKPASEWKDPRHRRGYAGERAALAYLVRQGWRIEAHRFRLGHHDLDIVARRRGLVAFVEVKSWDSRRFGNPLEGVGGRKQRIIARVAELWRARFGRPEDQFRFDVIAVTGVESTCPQITHIEGAWTGVDK